MQAQILKARGFFDKFLGHPDPDHPMNSKKIRKTVLSL
jgi:hypothetical protein